MIKMILATLVVALGAIGIIFIGICIFHPHKYVEEEVEGKCSVITIISRILFFPTAILAIIGILSVSFLMY